MSGQNAERSGGFESTDSRLDAILEQLNALGSSSHALDGPPSRLHRVPDLDPEPPVETHVDEQAPVVDEEVSHEQPQPLDSPPSLELIPPPIEPDVIEPVPPPSTLEKHDELDLVIEPPDTVLIAPPLPPVPVEVEPPPFEAQQAPVEFEQAPVGAPEQHVDDTVFASFPPVSAIDPDTIDQDSGWISHHESETQADTPPDSTGDDPPPDSTGDDPPNWEALQEVVQPTEIDARADDESAFGSPNWADVDVDAALEGSPEFPSELVETMLGEVDLFELPDPLDALTSHLDVEFPTELVDVAGHDGSPYETDEDLPLPDFTGVWVEDGEKDSWASEAMSEAIGALPEPVETARKGSGISVGRNELDSLRPVEEVAVAKESEPLGRKLQLMGVVLFGLIALAIIFLDDPAVVDELREIYEGFFG